MAGDLLTHFCITSLCRGQVSHPPKSARLFLRPTALAAACSSKHKRNCSSRFRHSSKSTDFRLPSQPATQGRRSKGCRQALQNRHRRSLPRSTRIDGNLVGLLTRASPNQGCLPKAYKPQWHSAQFSALTVAGAVLEFHQLPKNTKHFSYRLQAEQKSRFRPIGRMQHQTRTAELRSVDSFLCVLAAPVHREQRTANEKFQCGQDFGTAFVSGIRDDGKIAANPRSAVW